MVFHKTSLIDAYIIEPMIISDERGYFFESFNKINFSEIGIDFQIKQINESLSLKKGTLRGLHYQNHPKAQSKLIKCIKGKVLDVIVDLRPHSISYLKWESFILSENNHKQVFVPDGFAHGFITLKNNSKVIYAVDEFYSKEHDRVIAYNDESFKIEWVLTEFILSDKDNTAPNYKESDCNF